jgi:molybdopterin synthase catalytic subunit/molybdopterin converting factor small subunit
MRTRNPPSASGARMFHVRVRVLFFGRLRDIVGREADETELEAGARVEDLFASYSRRFPQLAELRPSIAPAINLEFADWKSALSSEDEVGFLPPVSGGSGAPAATAGEEICELIRAPLLRDEWLSSLAAPSDGAMVVFEGMARSHSRGRTVLRLEYEAYEPMAKTRMRELASVLRREFHVSRVVLVHRLGSIQIGEASILIGVTSPHRKASFDACRYAIDAFKRTVPIWKKEFFEDGSAWADGEPLPPAAPAPR